MVLDRRALLLLFFVLSTAHSRYYHNNAQSDKVVEAITRKDSIVLSTLFDEGADPDALLPDGTPVLVEASSRNLSTIVRLLLEAGADVNAAHNVTQRTALMAATASAGALDIVDDLLCAGANVNAQDTWGWTALMLSTVNGHVPISKKLLRSGANANVRNADGSTAIALASMRGFTHHVRLLAIAKANPDIANKKNQTPVILAILGGQTEFLATVQARINMSQVSYFLMQDIAEGTLATVERLHKAGADINAQDDSGHTALMYACMANNSIVVAYLLKQKCSVNTQQKDGWSALMISSYHGYEYIVKLLLDAGADIALTNKNGLNAFLIAQERDLPAIESLLENSHSSRIEMSVVGVLAIALLIADVYCMVCNHGDAVLFGKSVHVCEGVMGVDVKDLQIESDFVEANRCRVHRGTYRGSPVSIKYINYDAKNSAEVTILWSMPHERIIFLYGFFISSSWFGTELGLVMKFLPRGSLYDVLHSDDTPAEHRLTTLSSKLRVLKGVAEGMRFLHERFVVHGDLNAAIVLLDGEGRPKLSGFNSSVILSNAMEHTAPISCGSKRYTAPELFNADARNALSLSVDIYSFGVIVLEVLTGEIPWKGLCDSQIVAKVRMGRTIGIPDAATPPIIASYYTFLLDMARDCVVSMPDSRPLFSRLHAQLDEKLAEIKGDEVIRCPIGLEIMSDPVVCADGHTYERKNIEEWLKAYNTSPITRQVVGNNLTPNRAIKHLIESVAHAAE